MVLVALGLVAAFLGVVGDSAPGWASSLLATGGLGAFVVAGVLARGQTPLSDSSRGWASAYTELIAIGMSSSSVPGRGREEHPAPRASLVESAVGRRSPTTATPPPDPGRRAPPFASAAQPYRQAGDTALELLVLRQVDRHDPQPAGSEQLCRAWCARGHQHGLFVEQHHVRARLLRDFKHALQTAGSSTSGG